MIMIMIITARAYILTSNSINELTEKHDVKNDLDRILQAGGWITSLRENMHPRLGSIAQFSPTSASSPQEFVQSSSSSSSSSRQIQPFAEQPNLTTSTFSSSLFKLDPTNHSHETEENDHVTLPVIVTGNALPPPPSSSSSSSTSIFSFYNPSFSSTQQQQQQQQQLPTTLPSSSLYPSSMIYRQNHKHYVNGEIEVARSLGDFKFKLDHIRDWPWKYPSPERAELGVDGFVADVVSCQPYIR